MAESYAGKDHPEDRVYLGKRDLDRKILDITFLLAKTEVPPPEEEPEESLDKDLRDKAKAMQGNLMNRLREIKDQQSKEE